MSLSKPNQGYVTRKRGGEGRGGGRAAGRQTRNLHGGFHILLEPRGLLR